MSDKAMEVLADSLMCLTFACLGSVITICLTMPMQPKNVYKYYPTVTQITENPIKQR